MAPVTKSHLLVHKWIYVKKKKKKEISVYDDGRPSGLSDIRMVV